MWNPGEEGATLPFTPALRTPADDASFLRGLLEAIPAFVPRLDHEQRIQFTGRPLREFVASDDLQRFEWAISEALSTGRLCSDLVTGADTLLKWRLTRPCPGHRLTDAYKSALNGSPVWDVTYGIAMLSAETN